MSEFNVISVSQLNRYIKSKISSDEKLNGIFIEGEVSGFKNHITSGHFYFTLKDKTSSIKAVMFKSNASKLKFVPENGMNVIILGDVSVYERDGQYQLYAFDIIPKGTGNLFLAFEQLKEKLAKEGLFDDGNKKSLPRFPQKIGIVTSETGAAYQDILNILSRRYPIAEVVLCPVLVQGDAAPMQISLGIDILNKHQACDVIIVGRGGGSQEELWAFNTEPVARAIHRSKIPVISAVGHETDFSISDMVADLRAPTPSAAAELVSPNLLDIKQDLVAYFAIIDKYITKKVEDCSVKLINLSARDVIASPEKLIEKQNLLLKNYTSHLRKLETSLIDKYKTNIKSKAELLKSLDPMSIISRGYSVTYKDDELLTNTENLAIGDKIKVVMNKSEILATVNKINKKDV